MIYKAPKSQKESGHIGSWTLGGRKGGEQYFILSFARNIVASIFAVQCTRSP